MNNAHSQQIANALIGPCLHKLIKERSKKQRAEYEKQRREEIRAEAPLMRDRGLKDKDTIGWDKGPAFVPIAPAQAYTPEMP